MPGAKLLFYAPAKLALAFAPVTAIPTRAHWAAAVRRIDAIPNRFLHHGIQCLCKAPIIRADTMQETTVVEQDQLIRAILSAPEAPAPTMTLCSYGSKLTREELTRVETPAATATHKPIPHIAVVEKLIEALRFRQIAVVRAGCAVSSDGMKMFGVMDLSSGFEEPRNQLTPPTSLWSAQLRALSCIRRLW